MNIRVHSTVMAAVLLVFGTLVLGPACWSGMGDEFQRGMDFFSAREYGKAVQCFERVARGDADLAADACYQMGMCQFELRMLDDSITAFRRALTVTRSEDSILVGKIKTRLAGVYIEAEQYDAVSSLIQEIAPNDPETAGHLLFMCCLRQRDYERAAAALIHSLVTTPGVEHIGENGLPSWLLTPTDRQAIKSYVQSFCDAVARGGEIKAVPAIKADLQAMLEKCGKTDAAASVVASTFAQSDTAWEHATKLYNLAGVYFRGRRHKEAAQLFEDALKSGGGLEASEQSGAWYLLGVCRWKLNEMDAAKSCMSEVVTRFPDSDKAKWAKAHVASWSRAAAEARTDTEGGDGR